MVPHIPQKNLGSSEKRPGYASALEAGSGRPNVAEGLVEPLDGNVVWLTAQTMMGSTGMECMTHTSPRDGRDSVRSLEMINYEHRKSAPSGDPGVGRYRGDPGSNQENVESKRLLCGFG